MKNKFLIYLHSHLPYSLGKGRWPFGEEWLFEIAESTYIPLLKSFFNLKKEKINFKINIGITPVLMDQLKSEYFKEKFLEYIEIKEKRGNEDYQKYKNNSKIKNLIKYYLNELDDIKKFFIDINFDIVGAFNSLKNDNFVEIGTSSITHSYLPLLKYDYSRILQIKNGIKIYKNYLNKDPEIFWLPECGYRVGIEKILKENKIKYFILNYHSLVDESEEIFRYGKGFIKLSLKDKFSSLFLYEIDEGIYVLLRNSETSEIVWSRDYGYPGDGDYREFHKKSESSGFQYWRITDKSISLGEKDYYDYEKGILKAKIHAENFKERIEKIFLEFNSKYNMNGLIIAAFDTELFGHWWYEGVEFLKHFLKISSQSEIFETSLSNGIENEVPIKSGKFIESSWGLGGFHFTWYNSETMWMWENIHQVEDKFKEVFYKIKDKDRKNAILKEKFLLESSDFPFLVTTSTAKEYAIKRFNEHYDKFFRLIKNEIEPEEINKDDFVFNKIDFEEV
jgi:1,4-alpha-glucan branching enzyme